ncbi:MAG: PTS sugar transporter subunit IIA [Alphaproteobacteria bacterium]
MQLTDILSIDGISLDVDCKSKKQLFQHLSSVAEASGGIDKSVVFEAISEREKLGCTDLGSGVAIPHGKICDVETCQLIFTRLSTPIDFEADEPVQLVFCLLGCENAKIEPVKIVSRISRLVADPVFRSELLSATSAEEVFGIITNERLLQAA